jgi:ankyrin repeat protein
MVQHASEDNNNQLEKNDNNINSKELFSQKDELITLLAEDNYNIRIAASKGHLAVVQRLVQERGVQVNEKNKVDQTALMLAAEGGHLEVVQWLVQEGGAQINERDKSGQTALMYAAEGGHLEVVQWLVQEGGALVNERDKFGQTALMLAAEGGHLEVVQWLVQEGGALVNANDDNGWTVLMYAAEGGHLEVVQWLVQEGGALVNAKDGFGRTALMHAAMKGHLSNVQWLVQKGGVQVNAKDGLFFGQTALMLAVERGHLPVVRWLALYQWVENHKDELYKLADSQYLIAIKDYKYGVSPKVYHATIKALISHKAIAILRDNLDINNYAKLSELLNPKQQLDLIISALKADEIFSEEKLLKALVQGQLHYLAKKKLSMSILHLFSKEQQLSLGSVYQVQQTNKLPTVEQLKISANFHECIEQIEVDKHEMQQIDEPRLSNTFSVNSNNNSENIYYAVPTAPINQQLNRQGLFIADSISQKLVKYVPAEIQLGKAIGQGDCFFDAIAQALNHLTGKEEYTLKSLRLLCDEYVKDPNHTWVKEAIVKDKDNYEQYLTRIQFTADEMEEHEQKGLNLGPAVWGRPTIEGRMFCERFNKKIHVIEILEEAVDGNDILEQLVDAKGAQSIEPLAKTAYSDPTMLHLVIYKNHFVPLLDKTLVKVFQQPVGQSNDQSANQNQIYRNNWTQSEPQSSMQANRTKDLFTAAPEGNLNLKREKYEEIKKNDDKGWNVLMKTAINGCLEAVQRLVQEDGVQVNEKNKRGQTALMIAAYKGYLNVVQCLVQEGGAQVNANDDNGWTALMYAAYKGYLDVVQWLVQEGGALVNAKNKNGQTALMIAANKGHLEVVQWLVQEGVAKFDERNHKGYSVVNYFYNVMLKIIIDNKDLSNKCAKWLELLPSEQKLELIILVLKADEVFSDEKMLKALEQGQLHNLAKNVLSKTILSLFSKEQQLALRAVYSAQPKNKPLIDECLKLITDFNACVEKIKTFKHELQQKHANQSDAKPTRCVIESNIEKFWVDILHLQEGWDKNKKFTKLSGSSEQWYILLKCIENYYLISMQDMPYDATIAVLAKHVNGKLKASASLIRRYVPNGSASSNKKTAGIIFIHPISGGIKEFETLSDNINKEVLEQKNLSLSLWRSPLLNMDFDSINYQEYESLCSMAKQAELAIEGIRVIQPHGPYYLCGWSYGGILTVEIARQLQKQGEKIKFMGLIDPQTSEQLQALQSTELRKRLLIHINYVSGLLLEVRSDNVLVESTVLDVDKGGVELIKYAFVIAFSNLNNTFQKHKNFKKLKTILYTLQANYLAIYNYPCKKLFSGGNKLPTAIVYIASDKPDILDKKEYAFHDFAGITQVKLAEPLVHETDHFDIVIKPQFANLLTKHIKYISEIILANKFWCHLERHYRKLNFTSLQFLFDDVPFKILDCDLQIKSQNVNEKTIEVLFEPLDVIRHILLIGKAGIGKTTAARALTLKNISYQIWPQKRWVFTIDMHAVRQYTQAKEYQLSDNHKTIETLLYHHFFKQAGISFEQVATFWQFIKKEPQTICFILDSADAVIAEPALQDLWQALFLSHGISVIVSTRDHNLNQLKSLGFSPTLKFTVEEFTDDYYTQSFIKKYYLQLNKDEQGQALWQWLEKNNYIKVFCKTPLHLTMLCSIWNHHSSELTSQVEIKLKTLFEICIKNMFRRYLYYSNQIDLAQLNMLSDDKRKELTVNVTQFLERCAFESIKNNQQIIDANEMDQWLTQFNKGTDFFQNVLFSGFINPVNYAYYDIDREFQFNSQAIQLYFACQYVHHHYLTNLQDKKFERKEKEQELGNFIRHAIQQFEMDFIKALLLDPLKEAKNSQAFAYLLNLLNFQIQDYSELNTIKLIAYCCEAAYEYGCDANIITTLTEKIGVILYCFTSLFAESYNLNGQKNYPDNDSHELRIYKVNIKDLEQQCSQLFDAVKNNEKYKCAYSGKEGVLHYAIKKQDAGLVAFLLKLGANTELTNDEGQRPINIASKNAFKEGVDLINQYHREKLHEQLYKHWLNDEPDDIASRADVQIDRQKWWYDFMQAPRKMLNNLINEKSKQDAIAIFVNQMKSEVIQEYIQRWREQENSDDIVRFDNELINILKLYTNSREQRHTRKNNADDIEDNTRLYHYIQKHIVKAYWKNKALMQEAIFYMVKTNQHEFFKLNLHLHLQKTKKQLHLKYKEMFKLMQKIVKKEKERSILVKNDRSWALDEMIQQWIKGKIEQQAVAIELQDFITEAIVCSECTKKETFSIIFKQNKFLFLNFLLDKYRQNELSDEYIELKQALAGLIELVCEKCDSDLIYDGIAKRIMEVQSEYVTKKNIKSESDNKLSKYEREANKSNTGTDKQSYNNNQSKSVDKSLTANIQPQLKIYDSNELAKKFNYYEPQTLFAQKKTVASAFTATLTNLVAPTLKELANYLLNSDLFNTLPLNDSTAWATDGGINAVMCHYLDDSVHYMQAALTSVSCLFDNNIHKVNESIKNIIERIAGFYTVDGKYSDSGFIYEDNGDLKKPIIIIINTTSDIARSDQDVNAAGGLHWVCFVVLPKNYSILGMTCSHARERIYFINSLNKLTLPEQFKDALRNGFEYEGIREASIEEQFRTPDRAYYRYTHTVPAVFPEAEFIDLMKLNGEAQQHDSNNCGWWSVYNAIMLILTGDDKYVNQANSSSTDFAKRLRSLFPQLHMHNPALYLSQAQSGPTLSLKS